MTGIWEEDETCCLEAEDEPERSPAQTQVFHEFAVAKIVIQVAMAKHDGKPITEMVTDPGKSLQSPVGIDRETSDVKIVGRISLLTQIELAFETDNGINEISEKLGAGLFS